MKKVISFLPWIGALLLIAIALLCFEPDLLWKMQQYNLFLDTSLYFHELMLVPAGFLSYVSCFFIQFREQNSFIIICRQFDTMK